MYWENIQGMFNFDNIYNEMVSKYNNAVFVEIGCWKGKSAAYMAELIKDSKKNIKFYTIDLFEYEGKSFYEETLNNLTPLLDYVTIIKENSTTAYKRFEDNSIDFLFIDGDHTYEGCKNDIKLWFPKVKTPGIIAGHDYTETSCGVKMAVDQYFLFTGINKNRTSWVYYKK